MVQELFTEKFRPQTLEQMILPNRIESLVKSGELHQNLLFYGPPGSGKCVTDDTIITVLDEKTNKEMEMSFKDFIKLCQSQ